ncbi:helix-turn-helix transcriptional regulator [Pseudaeromonas sp. ZJS20]|uniref:helix-turn-helix domain-containing protein n=1 Tax=Pseudaeromonas aegiceratis TaxID=3153928 RepID=UPI00390CA9FC
MSKQSTTALDSLVGKRIQKRRKELGLSAAVMSEQLGISQQQLSRYERGANRIGLHHLLNIASFLGAPMSWFLMDYEPELASCTGARQDSIRLADDGLKLRLDQRWERMSAEQRRALLNFLDSF